MPGFSSSRLSPAGGRPEPLVSTHCQDPAGAGGRVDRPIARDGGRVEWVGHDSIEDDGLPMPTVYALLWGPLFLSRLLSRRSFFPVGAQLWVAGWHCRAARCALVPRFAAADAAVAAPRAGCGEVGQAPGGAAPAAAPVVVADDQADAAPAAPVVVADDR